MTDYMKEAERLAQAYADAVLLGDGNDEALAALLAHIQRGAPAPAEVLMPKPDTHCYDDDEQRDVWSHSADQMRTYGAACRAAGEAAGYARGLHEMLDCRTCRNYTRRGCIQTAQCVDGDGYRRATPVRLWSAALRGEVKP